MLLAALALWVPQNLRAQRLQALLSHYSFE